MPLKLAINGTGRVGRAAFKLALENDNFEVVAMNNLSGTEMLAHLIKYDSVYGIYDKEVSFDEKGIIVDGKHYRVSSEREPGDLPWKECEVDVVIEATGIFRREEQVQPHLDAGAKRVVLSSPPKGEGIEAFVVGVNDDKFSDQKIVSNASCTTNCIAPVVEILHRKYGIAKGMLTTIHSYTAGQNLLDGSHKDPRRARAAAVNMVPTTTGAAKATTKVIPDLKDLFDGMAIRVPTPNVSLSDLTLVLKKDASEDELNKAFKEAAEEDRYRGILAVTEDPIVSSDIIGNAHASIVDLQLTKVVDGNLAKIIAWYDNEWGYASSLLKLCEKVGQSI